MFSSYFLSVFTSLIMESKRMGKTKQKELSSVDLLFTLKLIGVQADPRKPWPSLKMSTNIGNVLMASMFSYTGHWLLISPIPDTKLCVSFKQHITGIPRSTAQNIRREPSAEWFSVSHSRWPWQKERPSEEGCVLTALMESSLKVEMMAATLMRDVFAIRQSKGVPQGQVSKLGSRKNAWGPELTLLGGE